MYVYNAGGASGLGAVVTIPSSYPAAKRVLLAATGDPFVWVSTVFDPTSTITTRILDAMKRREMLLRPSYSGLMEAQGWLKTIARRSPATSSAGTARAIPGRISSAYADLQAELARRQAAGEPDRVVTTEPLPEPVTIAPSAPVEAAPRAAVAVRRPRVPPILPPELFAPIPVEAPPAPIPQIAEAGILGLSGKTWLLLSAAGAAVWFFVIRPKRGKAKDRLRRR